MRQWTVAAIAMVACSGDPKPGEVGYLDCNAFDPSAGIPGMSCPVADLCCLVVEEADKNGRGGDLFCYYRTNNPVRQYECLSEIDCSGALIDMQCELCAGTLVEDTGSTYCAD